MKTTRFFKGFMFSLLVLSPFCGAEECQEVKTKHLPYGLPTGTTTQNVLVIRDIYALSANRKTKLADWVAYRLDQATVGTDAVETAREWAADPWLRPEDTLEPEDYTDAAKNLKVDRGHQAPLASFKGTSSWGDTNLLSNITPQRSDLNQGLWLAVESWERKLTKTQAVIYIITGPLYEKKMKPLPKADEPHKVPSGYWKVIVAQSTGTPSSPQVATFIMPQTTPRKGKLLNYLKTVDEVERRSGLDLLRDLPDDVETRIEADKNQAWVEASLK